MKGILNINKPAGWTSQDVVSKVKKILSVSQIGHMGTLDPQGTGVLLLGVGKAARLFSYFLNKEKVYEAEFTFGYETDTLDKDGKVVFQTDNIPPLNEIEKALKNQTGQLRQIPPQFSAKSVNGERAYKLARRGEKVELKPADVEIFDFKLIANTAQNTYKFQIRCSSGTYIRSICRDLAYSLNSYATMISINRLKCGAFGIEDSIDLAALSELKEKALIPVEKALINCDRLDLPESLYKSLMTGKKIEIEWNGGIFTVYCKNELFGLGKIISGILKIDTYLKD